MSHFLHFLKQFLIFLKICWCASLADVDQCDHRVDNIHQQLTSSARLDSAMLRWRFCNSALREGHYFHHIYQSGKSKKSTVFTLDSPLNRHYHYRWAKCTGWMFICSSYLTVTPRFQTVLRLLYFCVCVFLYFYISVPHI